MLCWIYNAFILIIGNRLYTDKHKISPIISSILCSNFKMHVLIAILLMDGIYMVNGAYVTGDGYPKIFYDNDSHAPMGLAGGTPQCK